MSTTETKIELVTEAIEALVLAQVIATNPACSDHERHIAVKNVGDARAVLSKALNEFLIPTLRVLGGGARQVIATPDARPASAH